MTEPSITVNGQSLTEGQTMALRVAVENFAHELEHLTQENLISRDLAEAYKARLNEIRKIIFANS